MASSDDLAKEFNGIIQHCRFSIFCLYCPIAVYFIFDWSFNLPGVVMSLECQYIWNFLGVEEPDAGVNG